MRKIYILGLFLIIAQLQVSASHIFGGYLSYKYLGGNQYQIDGVLYGDPTGIPLPGTMPITVNSTIGQQNLTLTISNQGDVCVGNSYIKAYTYSGTLMISGVPSTGVTLSYSTCCRPGFITNLFNAAGQSIYFETVIYPIGTTNQGGVSPRFKDNFGYILNNGAVDVFAFAPNNSDSIFVELVDAKGTNGGNLPYITGYAGTNPFGGLPSNTTVNNATGKISVSGAVPVGYYTIALKVSSYHQGVLHSTVHRDFPTIVSVGAQNITATLSIGNVQSNGSVNTSNGILHVNLTQGETLSFTAQAQLTGSGSISLKGSGPLFGNTTNTSGACVGGGCAQLTNLSSGTLPIAFETFNYVADTTHLPAGTDKFTFIMSILAEVNATQLNCDFQIPEYVLITVTKPASIWNSQNTSVCIGDSLQIQINGDTTNLSWNPTTGVSNPTSGSPYLYANASTTYTVTNLNTGDQITIDWIVNNLASGSVTVTPNSVTLDSAALFDQIVWYYMGVPIALNSASIAAPWPGYYFAQISKGGCVGFSDTAKIGGGNLIALFDPLASSTSVICDGSAAINLTYNSQHFNTLTSLNVVLPDSGLFKTSAVPSFKFKDANQTILASGAASLTSNGQYSLNNLNVSLMPGETYTIELESISGRMLFCEPAALPANLPNGLFTVNAATYMQNGSLQQDKYPYVLLGTASGIGIAEAEDMLMKVYPNPASDRITVILPEDADVLLYTTTGSLVLNTHLPKGESTLTLANLPTGVYVVHAAWGDVQTHELLQIVK